MQGREQADIRVGTNQCQGMPQAEAKRLAGIDMQQLSPDGIGSDAQPAPKVRKEGLKLCSRQRRLL